MEKRLIDANALRAQCDAPHWCVWMSEIDDAPTVDAVEVVRCRDCKWLYHGTCPKMLGKRMKLDDFCSYGERRDSDG